MDNFWKQTLFPFLHQAGIFGIVSYTASDFDFLFKTENQNEEQLDQEAFSKINGSSSHVRAKDAVHCIYSFIHLVRFDIQFDMKLKEFDTYCKERNNLENVLDDIISSTGEDNVIDGIDCF